MRINMRLWNMLTDNQKERAIRNYKKMKLING